MCLETEGLAAFTYGWFVRRHINTVTFLCRYAFKISSWETTSRFNCGSNPWRTIRSILRSALARNDSEHQTIEMGSKIFYRSTGAFWPVRYRQKTQN